MLIEKRDNYGEIDVLPENIHAWRKAVATLRETPNLGAVTIQLARAVREKCINEGLDEQVPHLYWEEALVGQHMVMSQRDLPEKKRTHGIRKRGLTIMSEATKLAHEFIKERGMTHLNRDSFRHLGRAATYKGDHGAAKSYYEQSRDLYLEESDPVARSRYLELQAFLSHTTIMTGEVEKGHLLAIRTHQAFSNSEEGTKLKEHDYVTWAIWASGVPIHVAHALIEIGEVGDRKEGLLHWLSNVEVLLVVPKGETTWGDENFTFRRNEIKAIRETLS